MKQDGIHSSAAAEPVEVVASARHALVSAAILLGLFVLSLKLFTVLHGRDALEDITRQPGGWLGALVVALISAAVHEFIHACGWLLLGRAPWRAMSIRASRRKLGAVAYLRTPVGVRPFRAALLLPAVVLAGSCVATGLATNRGLLLLWGLFFLFESFSDIALFVALVRVRDEQAVIELAGSLGCRLVDSHAPHEGRV